MPLSLNLCNAVLHSMLKNMTSTLNICHLNASSLFPKMSFINDMLSNINMHVICVSETWLNNTHSDTMVKIPNYTLVRHDRAQPDKKRGGGVAIYVRHDLGFNLLSKSAFGEQFEFIVLEIVTPSDTIVVGSVYNPPDAPKDCEKLRCILEGVINYENVVILGDFNLNQLRRDETVRRFHDMLAESSCYVLNSEPTHFGPNHASSCIDLIITKNRDKVVLHDQIDVPGISHHDLLVIAFAVPAKAKSIAKTLFRDYRRVNLTSLTEELMSLPWDDIYHLPDPNDQVSHFSTLVLHLLNAHVPLKILQTNNALPRDPALDHVRLDRDLAHRKWRRSGLSEDWALFDRLRGEAKRLEVSVLQNSYSTRFSPTLNNTELWRNIKVLGYKDSPSTIKTHSSEDLNAHFTYTPLSHHVSRPSASIHVNSDGLSFSNVHLSETMSAIVNIKSNATGNDNIPPKFIKMILPLVLPFINHIFNSILTTSIYPSTWKCARVIPIPKIQLPRSPADYRPISILPFLSKAFEKVVSKQIQHHLGQNRLLSAKQSGFRPSRSTTTALLDITEDIRAGLDKGQVNVMVLLDFSKAFDSVNHSLLIEKLSSLLGFSSSACSLIHSYLNERSQFVEQHDDSSSLSHLARGVPQGSVLGPLLFSMFINDLPLYITHSKCHMFADDVQLLAASHNKNFSELICKINDDLTRINGWALENELILNPSKTVAQLISRSSTSSSSGPHIKLGDRTIPFSPVAKNLGMWIDERLSWRVHVTKTCGKVYGSLSRLWKIAWALPQLTRLRLVRALVVPIFSYGCIVYSGMSAELKAKLQVALNACTRFVFGLRKRDRIGAHHNTILGCTLTNYFEHSTCNMLFKIIKNHEPSYLYDRLSFSRSARLVGLKVPLRRLSSYNGMFFLLGPGLWNALPRELRTTRSEAEFKRKLKLYYTT